MSTSEHTHDHDHQHGHDHHHHPHPKQPDLEDSPLSHYQAMTLALGELLIEKSIVTGDEIRRMIEIIDAKSPADGARLVARAWVDQEFEQRLLQDVNAAAAEFAIDAGPIPILAVKNTPQLHNVIVCTLCSCYPRMLLGLPPDWYKSRAYRSRMVREPRAVLAEFGTAIPADVEVRVHDSTADLRYLVLPQRPPGSENMNETELAALVTRDSMIGVTQPKAG
jgi:nitrile hydratase